MNCPKCSADLKPWPWQDGGYKGVQCTGCEARWWSDSVESRLMEAEAVAVAIVMAGAEFPHDAKTDEEYRKFIGAKPEEW